MGASTRASESSTASTGTPKRGGKNDFATARGVVTFDRNIELLLVEAEAERVSAALAASRPGSRVEPNVSKAITLDQQGLIVAQLEGHTWSLVYRAVWLERGVGEVDAKALSEVLGCRAMFYANGDTASVMMYFLYERGSLLESMSQGAIDLADFDDENFDTEEASEKLVFESPGLGTNPSTIRDPDEYVDQLFRRLDALEPSFSPRFVSQTKAGDRFALDWIAAPTRRVDHVVVGRAALDAYADRHGLSKQKRVNPFASTG